MRFQPQAGRRVEPQDWPQRETAGRQGAPARGGRWPPGCCPDCLIAPSVSGAESQVLGYPAPGFSGPPRKIRELEPPGSAGPEVLATWDTQPRRPPETQGPRLRPLTCALTAQVALGLGTSVARRRALRASVFQWLGMRGLWRETFSWNRREPGRFVRWCPRDPGKAAWKRWP